MVHAVFNMLNSALNKVNFFIEDTSTLKLTIEDATPEAQKPLLEKVG